MPDAAAAAAAAAVISGHRSGKYVAAPSSILYTNAPVALGVQLSGPAWQDDDTVGKF